MGLRTRCRWNALRAGAAAVVLVGSFASGGDGLMGSETPPVVFASRYMDADPNSVARGSAIERALSGRLLVRAADGSVRPLVDATLPDAPADLPVDVMHPDVSYDGQRVVFAGFSQAEDAWRIFEVGADGSGLRQITRSDRELDLARYGAAAERLRGYDDVDPAFLPDGRVVFVSTRYPGIAPDSRLRATNLYIVGDDGSDLHRITSERFGADTPTVDPTTGQIVYSRWWRTPAFSLQDEGREVASQTIDPGSPGYDDFAFPSLALNGEATPVLASVGEDEFPGLNSWFLATINPDGTGMSMHSGAGLDRRLTQAHRPHMLPGGEALALFIPRTPFLGLPRGDGLRVFYEGPSQPAELGGPQEFASNESRLEGDFGLVYAAVGSYGDGQILVSAASAADPTDYDIYVQDGPAGTPHLLHRGVGSAELSPVALSSRPVPPVIEDEVDHRHGDDAAQTLEDAVASGGTFRFLVENIFFNAPVDVDVANAPPVGQDLVIEFFMNPQRTSVSKPDEPILVHRQELGPDGKVDVRLPAGVPLFEVLRFRNDPNSFPIGRDGQIFHVGGLNFGQTGETGRCVGCHAGHSMLEVPEDPTWTNLAPSAESVVSSVLRLAEGDNEPALLDQDLIDFFDVFPEELLPRVDADQFELRGDRLVDRRTTPIESEWAAAEEGGNVELRWPVPIRAREAVVYAPRQVDGTFGPRSQAIGALTLVTSNNGVVQQEIAVNETIRPDGTHVALDPSLSFESLQVRIDGENVSGLFEGRNSVALAEIEVIARVATAAVPLLRGDSNCDQTVDLSDALSVLNLLFLGGETLCCEAAGDVNVTNTLDITDPLYLFNFLFMGGPTPASPFPSCGEAVEQELPCSETTCAE